MKALMLVSCAARLPSGKFGRTNALTLSELGHTLALIRKQAQEGFYINAPEHDLPRMNYSYSASCSEIELARKSTRVYDCTP
jgi:hypothetical protein